MLPNTDDSSEILFTSSAASHRGIKLKDTPTAQLWRVEDHLRLYVYKSLRREMLGDMRYRHQDVRMSARCKGRHLQCGADHSVPAVAFG